jgi:hypothetical protein
LRRALHDRTVVCVTHDPLVEAPGDTVLDLSPQQPAGPSVKVGELIAAVR